MHLNDRLAISTDQVNAERRVYKEVLLSTHNLLAVLAERINRIERLEVSLA
jgi:hypothetical protein